MKQPWLKFYPSDWRADPALRMCSLAARGLWMEMLCLMHAADPPGSLLVNSNQIQPKQLSSLSGCTTRDIDGLLSELEAAGVFSRDEDGTIYSRRIRRDIAKAERDKNNGKGGGNPSLVGKDKAGVNPRDNGVDKAQKPEARSQKSSLRSQRAKDFSEAFDRFWAAFVHRPGDAKEPAWRKFKTLISAGVLEEEIIAGAERWAAALQGTESQFWPGSARWLNEMRWRDAPPQPNARAGPRQTEPGTLTRLAFGHRDEPDFDPPDEPLDLLAIEHDPRH